MTIAGTVRKSTVKPEWKPYGLGIYYILISPTDRLSSDALSVTGHLAHFTDVDPTRMYVKRGSVVMSIPTSTISDKYEACSFPGLSDRIFASA